nr:hypothetical protein [uncultured Undibacterium sp.]
MKSSALRINTPIGELEFTADADVETTSQLNLSAAPFAPSLPNEMSVTACYGVLLHIHASQATTGIHFKARLHPTVPLEHGAETGEGLEAQAWYGDEYVLLVGTEDAEFLQARLREHIIVSKDSFSYSENSISVRVSHLPKAETLSLHFIVAWNEFPEPHDCSCWYAVDQPHNTIGATINI